VTFVRAQVTGDWRPVAEVAYARFGLEALYLLSRSGAPREPDFQPISVSGHGVLGD
jgi:hypothetical protein